MEESHVGEILTLKGVEAEQKVVYIIHEETGRIITSQCKAWNDTVRMIAWFEVIMKPIRDGLGKMLLWNDNCSSHKTSIVRDVITAIGMAYLPRNMTQYMERHSTFVLCRSMPCIGW